MGMDEGQCMIVDGAKCTGCRVCELVCSMQRMGEYNPRKSYVRLIKNREMDVNIVCLDIRCDFCGVCVGWCPTEALSLVSMQESAIIRKEDRPKVYPAPILGKA